MTTEPCEVYCCFFSCPNCGFETDGVPTTEELPPFTDDDECPDCGYMLVIEWEWL
jgi:predicted RNA-binding Zn-ribbon protein involved in translation (DUF1610 family)